MILKRLIHYDIYGRPIFNMKKRKSNTVSINNINKKLMEYKIPKIKSENKNKVLNLNDKNKNKEKSSIDKFVYFENNYNNNNSNNNNNNLNSSDRSKANIYNLKIPKHRTNNINII